MLAAGGGGGGGGGRVNDTSSASNASGAPRLLDLRMHRSYSYAIDRSKPDTNRSQPANTGHGASSGGGGSNSGGGGGHIDIWAAPPTRASTPERQAGGGGSGDGVDGITSIAYNAATSYASVFNDDGKKRRAAPASTSVHATGDSGSGGGGGGGDGSMQYYDAELGIYRKKFAGHTCTAAYNIASNHR